MRVIVHAEDHSGRGDGHYTKPHVKDALDIFFETGEPYYLDPDGEYEMKRLEAEDAYRRSGEVTFYNQDAERISIMKDWNQD